MGKTNMGSGPLIVGGCMLTPGGLPYFGGRYYFVDYVNGNDGNDGLAATQSDSDQRTGPMQTLLAAYNASGGGSTTDGKNDIICVIGGGGTGSTYTQRVAKDVTSTPVGFCWSKSNLHLWGLCPPQRQHQRARISCASTDITMTTLFYITGSNCFFGNLAFFIGHAGDVDQIAVYNNAIGNYFYNCSIQGGVHATCGARAGIASLKLAGAENTFQGCTIGNTTIQKSAASGVVTVVNGTASALTTTRTKFFDCDFETAITTGGTGHTFIKVGSYGIDRFMEFQDCRFLAPTNGAGQVMLQVFSLHATQNGSCYMPHSWFDQAQCTTWSTADTGLIKAPANYNGTNTTKSAGVMVAVLAP